MAVSEQMTRYLAGLAFWRSSRQILLTKEFCGVPIPFVLTESNTHANLMLQISFAFRFI
jgi:hypothetical protein